MEIKTCIPQRLPIKELDWSALIPLIGQAREALGRFDTTLHKISPQTFDLLKWEESVASLRALHVNANLREVLQFVKHKKIQSERKKKILQKVIDVKKGLDFAISWATKKQPLNISFYCQLHKIVKRDAFNPKEVGRLRKWQNWIGPQGCTIDKAYFYPPAPQKVKKYLQNLIHYSHTKEKDPIVQTAIFFAQFLVIHPFMDGNGRVARIFIPLYLMKKNLISKPCLFMSEYFAKHRLSYFQKLFYVSDKDAWEDWIVYFLKGVIEQAEKLSKPINRY